MPRLNAVTDSPVMSDIFWLKVVICSVKVCLKVSSDCLMKVRDLSCPGAGLNSRFWQSPTIEAEVCWTSSTGGSGAEHIAGTFSASP